MGCAHNHSPMKKQVILFLLLLSYVQVVAFPPTDKILFIDGRISQVEQLAATEGKLYFVHFTAQWCMPCQWMEKNTFEDPALVQFVNKNYLAVKVDVDQAEGRDYKRQYQVKNLPTILVFNSKGQLKERWETSLSGEKLLNILQKHNVPSNRTAIPQIVAKPDILESPRPLFTAMAVPQPTLSSQSLKPETTTVASFSPSLKPPRPAVVQSTNAFGIQVGVFSHYNNAVGEIMRLESKLNQPVHLSSSQHNGKQLYKIIVGRFADRTLASAYLSELRRQSINGIIKELE